MECLDAKRLLDASLDGQLGPADEAAVQTHLAQCSDCQTIAEQRRAEDGRLREAFAPRREAAVAVAENVIRQLRQQSSRHAPRTVAAPCAAADASNTTAKQADGTRSVPARRTKRWIELAMAAAVGFLAALLLFPPGDHGERRIPVPVAHLTLASGGVQVRGPEASGWQTAPPGTRLSPGHLVRTPADVRAELRTADGVLVRVNQQTELKVDSKNDIQVAHGQAWFSSPPSKSLTVTTGGCAVACSGGKFNLRCANDETVVAAAEGEVEVTADGKRQSLKRGEALKVVAGQVPPRPEAIDLIEVTRWLNQLLVLKGRDDAELRQRVDELLAQVGQGKMKELHEEEIRSLGDYCVLPLTRYVQSPSSRETPVQRLEAMRLVSDLAQPWSISDLIELLADQDAQVRYLAATALKRLTGQTLGCPPDQWRASPWAHGTPTRKSWSTWWGQHQKTFPSCVAPPERK